MDPITINALLQTGRLTEIDSKTGKVFSSFNLDFAAAANYIIDFSVQSQGQTFGACKSMFLDNSSNPTEVEVLVQGTDQFFVIPANSIGYYQIDATAASRINLVTDGGATDKVTVTFYNWERAPVVWYKFGTFNSDKPVMTYGTMEEGDIVSAQGFNDPIYMGGIDRNTGQFHGLLVDSDGRLSISAIVTGPVYGANPIGAVPAFDPVYVSGIDETGDAADFVIESVGGHLRVVDAAANTKLATLVENTDKGVTGTQSSVAGAAVDTVILAANAARQAATVYNDSTAVLYLLLSNAVSSATVNTVQLQSGDYYEVPAKYTGIIKGIWASATGAARVTEIV